MKLPRWLRVGRKPAPSETAPLADGWSLRRRLFVAVMGTSVVLWLITLSIIVGVAWFATSDVFDDALEEGSRLVLQLAPLKDLNPEPAQYSPIERSDELKLRMYYQLVAPDGRVLVRGEDTPRAAFLPDARSKTKATVWSEGEFWRVHVRPGPGGLTAQVGQPMEDRLDMLEDMAENLVWPVLGLLATLGLLSWFLIWRLMRPLEDTAKRIKAKSPADLTPVQMQNPPRELQPMLHALNALLARLATALESERRFTAYAAHELRTPLAALRMRIQVIERELNLPAPQLRQLRADLDRCTTLVESLLALTRLEPQAGALARELIDLEALLDGLNIEPTAKGIRIERALEATRLRAEPTLLASALHNLIDNAIRYGREGGRIRIEAASLPHGGIRLAVRDDGMGVPAEQRDRLGERFFRVLGTGQVGNGLGLSIVARIAALHGASLHFDDGLNGRGLSVMLDFPAEQSA